MIRFYGGRSKDLQADKKDNLTELESTETKIGSEKKGLSDFLDFHLPLFNFPFNIP